MSNAHCNLCKNRFDTLADLVKHLRAKHQVLPQEETSVGPHLSRRTTDYGFDDLCPVPTGHDPERRRHARGDRDARSIASGWPARGRALCAGFRLNLGLIGS